MIREELKKILRRTIPGEEIHIDYVPKDKPGDYSTNLAFKIAAKTGEKPLKVAERIIQEIKDPMIAKITIHEPGFVNFEIDRNYLIKCLISENNKINIGQGKKILVEFVSVNPTGPINVVNARAAAVGDSLVKLLKATGYKASAEYYVNDAGRQTDLLAESVRQRMNELLGKKAAIPEGGYHGEYIIDLAREVISKSFDSINDIKKYAVNYFIAEQQKALKDFGVTFDYWIHESDIYKKGLIERVMKTLNKKNLTYLEDGAQYFKTTEFGDDKDRVITTSDKRNTYLLTDIAYHLDKIKRKYRRLINIWGPDHHGRIKGLIGGIEALGYARDTLKVLIVQEVKLKKDGKFISMSKREGTVATLGELLEQVPKDVVRFFFLMRACSQHLDFDLDLALKQSDENPIYYVQYAYARIKSILNFAKEKGVEYKSDIGLFTIKELEEIALIKDILKFPEILEDAVRNFEPYMISYYLIDLARTFHNFYQRHRVVCEDKSLTQARLMVVSKAAETIKKGLDLLGVSCPEKM